jgi:hypothetical protein
MSNLLRGEPVPEWIVGQWLNTDTPLTLASLRGRVVVVHAFQMLCPGCVSHGVPQAERAYRYFRKDDVAVVGLHTVFEHHEAMTPVSLRAFVHENRISHPVGIDVAVPGDSIPATMRAYGLEGTPTLLLIDREGRLRLQHLGPMEDFAVGAEIARLL